MGNKKCTRKKRGGSRALTELNTQIKELERQIEPLAFKLAGLRRELARVRADEGYQSRSPSPAADESLLNAFTAFRSEPGYVTLEGAPPPGDQIYAIPAWQGAINLQSLASLPPPPIPQRSLPPPPIPQRRLPTRRRRRITNLGGNRRMKDNGLFRVKNKKEKRNSNKRLGRKAKRTFKRT